MFRYKTDRLEGENVAIPKYVQIAEVLRHRIEHGDYFAEALPGAPKLMQEFGVSYMTIRQAMQKLINDGDVIRAANGRLEVPGGTPRLQVAYIHPPIMLNDKWRNAIAEAARKYGCSYQDIPFCYCDDAVIYETLDKEFDVIFFQIQISSINQLLLDKLRRRKEQVVSLFTDLTPFGIRCFDGLNIEAISHLMSFLHQRGCRRIDFMSVDPGFSYPNPRQAAWERALKQYGCTGEVWDDRAVPPETSIAHAINLTDRLVREGKLEGADAIFCTSVDAARGVIRSFADHGIRVPEDIAVTSFGNPELARTNTPSITVVNTPDLMPLISRLFEHYLGINPEPERLHYRFELEGFPSEALLQIGESTASDYHKTGRRRILLSTGPPALSG